MQVRFKLLAPIDGGGFADVFKARRSDGAVVAVKMLREHDDPAARRHFVREVRQLKTFAVNGLMPVLAANLDAEKPWYAMPLMGGGPLSQWAGKLPAAVICQIARKAATVLMPMHAVGAVHGDIKAANVLVGADRTVWISDLGLGRDPRFTFRFGSSAGGTYGYIAPEYERRHPPHPPGDIYALGATLFNLTTGTDPGAVNSLDPWTIDRRVPRLLRDLIVVMTQRDANLRPTVWEIAEYLGGPLEQPVRVPARPSPLAKTLAGLGLVALGIGVASAIAAGDRR